MAKATEPKIKSISEVLPKIEFYPDLPRSDWKSLVDTAIIVYDAAVIDIDSDYGAHKAALIKYVLADDVKKEYTTITSGAVIVDKMAKLITKEAMKAGSGFPVFANVKRVNSEVKGHSPYYDLI